MISFGQNNVLQDWATIKRWLHTFKRMKRMFRKQPMLSSNFVALWQGLMGEKGGRFLPNHTPGNMDFHIGKWRWGKRQCVCLTSGSLLATELQKEKSSSSRKHNKLTLPVLAVVSLSCRTSHAVWTTNWCVQGKMTNPRRYGVVLGVRDFSRLRTRLVYDLDKCKQS